MEIRRFFAQPQDISDNTVTLWGDEFAHLSKVLRYKVGYKAVVCANDGVENYCTVTEIGKDSATLRIDESRVADRKNVSVTLYAGLLKNNKLDFVIQKAVELGIDRVVPFVSQNSAETKFALDRANKIAKEAAKQCGSAYLTVIEPLCELKDVAEELKNYDTSVMAYEFETKTRIKDVAFSGKNIALIVGCEGGFQKHEAEMMREKGANIVTLGRRILRAETAGIVVCALALDALGELDHEG